MLRNCLKKGFRPVAVLVVAVLMCSLGGCSDSESGWLEGRAFTMNAYSNTGELTLTSHAEKIGLDGNVTTDSRYRHRHQWFGFLRLDRFPVFGYHRDP